MTHPQVRPSLTPVNPARAAQALDAAIVLFAEKGYRGTTINDIADLMGIRGPSLYKHVTSKQEILRDIFVSTMDLLLEHQREAIAGNATPEAQLREMTRAVVLDHVENRPRAYVCIRELASLDEPARQEVQQQRDDYWRVTRGVIKRGLRSGVFSVRSSAVAAFCVVELTSSPASWYSNRSRLSHGDIADQIAEMALRLVGCRS
jgi:AcrR family transcriptional regulator